MDAARQPPKKIPSPMLSGSNPSLPFHFHFHFDFHFHFSVANVRNHEESS